MNNHLPLTSITLSRNLNQISSQGAIIIYSPGLLSGFLSWNNFKFNTWWHKWSNDSSSILNNLRYEFIDCSSSLDEHSLKIIISLSLKVSKHGNITQYIHDQEDQNNLKISSLHTWNILEPDNLSYSLDNY